MTIGSLVSSSTGTRSKIFFPIRSLSFLFPSLRTDLLGLFVQYLLSWILYVNLIILFWWDQFKSLLDTPPPWVQLLFDVFRNSPSDFFCTKRPVTYKGFLPCFSFCPVLRRTFLSSLLSPPFWVVLWYYPLHDTPVSLSVITFLVLRLLSLLSLYMSRNGSLKTQTNLLPFFLLPLTLSF